MTRECFLGYSASSLCLGQGTKDGTTTLSPFSTGRQAAPSSSACTGTCTWVFSIEGDPQLTDCNSGYLILNNFFLGERWENGIPPPNLPLFTCAGFSTTSFNLSKWEDIQITLLKYSFALRCKYYS